MLLKSWTRASKFGKLNNGHRIRKDQFSFQPQRKEIPVKSVQFSRSVVSNSLRLHGLQHARLPCPPPTPRVYSNLCPLSQ